jgi:hypothetical protein
MMMLKAADDNGTMMDDGRQGMSCGCSINTCLSHPTRLRGEDVFQNGKCHAVLDDVQLSLVVEMAWCMNAMAYLATHKHRRSLWCR